MSRRPFLASGIASFLSTLVTSGLTPFWVQMEVALLIGTLVLSGLFCRERWARCVVWIVTAALIPSGVMAFTTARMERLQEQYGGTTVTATVRVLDAAQEDGFALVKVESGLKAGTRMMVWTQSVGHEVRAGDRLSGSLELTAAFNVQVPQEGQWAKTNRVAIYANPADDTVLLWHEGRSSMPLIPKAIAVMRETICDCMDKRVSPLYAPLCKAITVGERDGLSASLKESFRACGVYHILAVSGLHLSVIVGALLWTMRSCCLPRRLRAGIAIAAVVLFAALCGFSPSVTRAGLMTVAALASTLFRRRAEGLNSLGMAAMMILSVDPFAVLDIGWRLSFAAALGLLVMLPIWEREMTARVRTRMPRLASVTGPISTAVGVTVCATLTTLPITAFTFGECSSIFLPCNLLLVPIMSAVLIAAMVGVIAAGVVPPLAGGIFWCLEWVCRWLCALTERLASFPWSTVYCGDMRTVIWLTCLPFMLVMAYRWFGCHGALRALALMICVACVGGLVHVAFNKNAADIYVASTERPVFSVQTDDSFGVVFMGGDEEIDALETLARQAGRTRVDWVLWVGTFASSRNQRVPDLSVERLLLTEDSAFYGACPSASRVDRLWDGDTVQFSDTASFTIQGGWIRFCVGDHVLLSAVPWADAAFVETSWMQADTAVFSTTLPAHWEQIRADTVMLCGDRFRLASVGNRLTDIGWQVRTPPPGLTARLTVNSRLDLPKSRDL